MNMMKSQMTSLSKLWDNYQGEVRFFVILSLCVALGHWLARFIPVDFFENVLLPIEHSATTAICLLGSWLLFSHADGLRIRRACGFALAIWGLSEVLFIVQACVWDQQVLSAGSNALSTYMLIAGDFLGWLLLIYPTETLRPGWLNVKRGLLQLLPLVVLWIVDYLLPVDLRWLISLYPILLFALVVTHIRAYRIWCENNYSSMEHIDVQWIVRYLIMLFVMGASFAYMMVSSNPCRAFTQNLLLQFMFIYSVEQILFRQNPWPDPQEQDNAESEPAEEPSDNAGEPAADPAQAENIRILEAWMESEKPYQNPDFKLIDLRAVLPMNRTYLSELINSYYGYSFYHLVKRYRMEEAKRLMREHPEMKMNEIAYRTGFSSPNVFSKVFSDETGLTPREWSKRCNAQ
jgi:AraC-like DNA-binding protein